MADGSGFGANQNSPSVTTNLGSGGNVGNEHYDQSGIGLGGIVDALSTNYKERTHLNNEAALGKDLETANGQLDGITNPVELDIRHRSITNMLTGKYGAMYSDQIRGGLSSRQMKQVFDPSEQSINTVDTVTGQIMSKKPMDPQEQAQSKVNGDVAQHMAEFPTATKLADSMISTISASGTPVSANDLQTTINTGNSTINQLDRSLMMLQGAQKDPTMTMPALDSMKASIANDLTNGVVNTLSSLNNPTMARALRDGKSITPDQAVSMARAYMNDMTQHFTELHLGDNLGMDAKTFQGMMQQQIDILGNQYRAAYADDNAATTREAAKMQAFVSIYKDKAMLDLFEKNPGLPKQLAVSGVVQAMAETQQSYQMLGTMWPGMSTDGKMNAQRSIFSLTEGSENNRKNVGRMQNTQLTDYDSVRYITETTKDVLTSPTGMQYLPDLVKYWNEHYKDMDEIAKKEGQTNILDLYNQLKSHIKQANTIADSVAGTATPKDDNGVTNYWAKTRATLEQLYQTLNGSNATTSRPRPGNKGISKDAFDSPTLNNGNSDNIPDKGRDNGGAPILPVPPGVIPK